MSIQTLDLSQERCPMSLLLVKRSFKPLGLDEQLHIQLIDESSIRDILNYLMMQNADVDCSKAGNVTTLTVSKQENL
ncbi:sulfurtransferase TusA family protein [Vibrio methylphosphonaticus]|uniref:sulfurtransferase TusA family protein n=1 Tax=Vibrio methylphosphonaticus TaxID=2946866 RepID=UPI0038730A86